MKGNAATPSRSPASPMLSRAELARVGVRAGCDPRTVERYLDGERVMSTTRLRVERALRALGFERFVLATE